MSFSVLSIFSITILLGLMTTTYLMSICLKIDEKLPNKLDLYLNK